MSSPEPFQEQTTVSMDGDTEVAETYPDHSISRENDMTSNFYEGPKVTEKETNSDPMHPSQFPDGGFTAWLTVLGGFCALFVSFGK